jgi:hypothetical protein
MNPIVQVEGLRKTYREALSDAARVEVQGQRVTVYGQNGRQTPLVSEVISLLSTQQVPFGDLHIEQPTLEDVFLSLTGREMRE